jgi:hypothetical protein
MDGTHVGPAVRVARPLELSTIQVAVAVLALTRELDTPMHRWTLGAHGSFELDSAFAGLTLGETTRRGEQCISTRGRLWSPDGMAVSGVMLTIESGIEVSTEIALTATAALPPAFAADLPAYLELADAAAAEVADELRYHANFQHAA